MEIVELLSNEEIILAYPVMKELRPHLFSDLAFLTQVRQQQNQNYKLLALKNGPESQALAGIRILTNLVHGKIIYVDDLVTKSGFRGMNLGQRLLGHIEKLAIKESCISLVLDTALSNAGAQKFYFRCGLQSTGLHFKKSLIKENV